MGQAETEQERHMYAVIVANAPDLDAGPYAALLGAADLLIAADGGALPLLRLGLLPQLVIGDLDSLDGASAAQLVERGVELRRFPRAKDETDLELALLHAVACDAHVIDILGALGGRWDHTLANVALLALPELRGRRVRLLADRQELFLAHDEVAITGRVGDTVSLLPLTPEVRGVTTRGLLYPLEQATLGYERARGISNVLLAPPGSVTVREGLLLVVHHDDEGAYQWRAAYDAHDSYATIDATRQGGYDDAG
jgi:thiamine pyrophosphokinase